MNNYTNSSVQKLGIPGFPVCLKYTGVVKHIFREAREGKGNLAALWLYLTNAYGYIPHKLLEVLKR